MRRRASRSVLLLHPKPGCRLAAGHGLWRVPGPPGTGCQSQSGLPQTQRPRRRMLCLFLCLLGVLAAPWGSGPQRREPGLPRLPLPASCHRSAGERERSAISSMSASLDSLQFFGKRAHVATVFRRSICLSAQRARPNRAAAA